MRWIAVSDLSRQREKKRWSAGDGCRASFLGAWANSTRDFWSGGCAAFNWKAANPPPPSDGVSTKSKKGHCSVSWKTALCQPAGGKEKKGRKERKGTKIQERRKPRVRKRRIQQE